MPSEALKRGDRVEVRSPGEILSTLDPFGALEHLPFMPEMALLCGQRFEVGGRTEKICDTVNWTGSRRLRNAVFLSEDPRCSGSGHDGCQAQCRIIWKEAWLQRIPLDAAPAEPVDAAQQRALLERVARNTRLTVQGEKGPEEKWRCQATELPEATESLRALDPVPYIREFACGNVGLSRFLTVTARAAVEEPLHRLGLAGGVHLPGPAERAPVIPPLNLKPGELVRVKSKEEIRATLNTKGMNKGLWFDREMMYFCGGVFRVKQRISHFIDDRTARMIDLKTDAVMLENVVCTGDRVPHRWFCERRIYPWWRECWLERADAPATANAAGSAGSTPR
jgi:hypothetical protein